MGIVSWGDWPAWTGLESGGAVRYRSAVTLNIAAPPLAFPEDVKKEARERARYTCVWCQRREYFLEVHHIQPQEQGGPDTLDNAAPLCPQCHTHIGPNDDLRKQLRERRDWWWHECAREAPTANVALFEKTNAMYERIQSMEAQGQRTEGLLNELKAVILGADDRRRDAISSASTAKDVALATTLTAIAMVTADITVVRPSKSK